MGDTSIVKGCSQVEQGSGFGLGFAVREGWVDMIPKSRDDW